MCIPPIPPVSFDDGDPGEETPQKTEAGKNESHSGVLTIDGALIGEKPNLQENLEKVLDIFQEKGREQSEETLLALLKDPHGIGEAEGRKLLSRLKEDGMIQRHLSHEGWWILTTGGR